ncbi:MFS transporter [Neobittarella massiliensis]|uniref:MFS transporter n=1 Tax=Neobittarella massiliensis (ex Bilen et al. 2018) TaxID=2041842 RepID=UPI000CF6475B|nr:MFS transporter [Neobittarella massiliensis]
MKKLDLTREELSWSLYDWASSAFTLMLSTVIPIYLKNMGDAAGLRSAQTTSHWAVTQSIATLLVAIMAPVLGAMADRRGKKKLFFCGFLALALLFSCALAGTNSYYLLLVFSLVASIGYAGTNIFYDAFIVDVTSDERMDFISSFGYAIGYIGSCIPFIAGILLINFTPFGLSATGAVKAALLINVAWWLVFSIPLIKNVRQKYQLRTESQRGENLFLSSFKKTWSTLKVIFQDKTIGLFLLSYFFYIDGVDTIIKMSTSFGKDVGIGDNSLLLALLMTQIIAFPAVLICAKLVRRFSSKKIILTAILVYIGITVFGFVMQHAWQFWVLAVFVAVVQGTIQALSRSYFGKLIPNKENANEYFGFYNIFGKYASIFGTALMALFTTLTGSSRYGVLSVALLFIAGFFLFLKVPDVEK